VEKKHILLAVVVENMHFMFKKEDVQHVVLEKLVKLEVTIGQKINDFLIKKKIRNI